MVSWIFEVSALHLKIIGDFGPISRQEWLLPYVFSSYSWHFQALLTVEGWLLVILKFPSPASNFCQFAFWPWADFSQVHLFAYLSVQAVLKHYHLCSFGHSCLSLESDKPESAGSFELEIFCYRHITGTRDSPGLLLVTDLFDSPLFKVIIVLDKFSSVFSISDAFDVVGGCPFIPLKSPLVQTGSFSLFSKFSARLTFPAFFRLSFFLRFSCSRFFRISIIAVNSLHSRAPI